MGVVSIDVFLMCVESLPNFHGENLATFCLIFLAEIWQCIALDASQRIKCYSHQAFDMRIWQWECPIFTAKIRHSFAFGALWCISRSLRLCIRQISTCSYCDELKPFKASSKLMRAIYTGKPMSFGDMDQDNHSAMIVHTIQHEYAPTAIRLERIHTLKGQGHS